MAACTFCGTGEDNLRFLVGGLGSTTLCDRCLCSYATTLAVMRGNELPPALGRLGAKAPKMWPLERQLRRINYLQRSGQLNVPKRIAGAIARGLARFERKPARPASELRAYFIRPAVRPFASLERLCGFCGKRPRIMMKGSSGGFICLACIEHASRSLLG